MSLDTLGFRLIFIYIMLVDRFRNVLFGRRFDPPFAFLWYDTCHIYQVPDIFYEYAVFFVVKYCTSMINKTYSIHISTYLVYSLDYLPCREVKTQPEVARVRSRI